MKDRKMKFAILSKEVDADGMEQTANIFLSLIFLSSETMANHL